MNSISDEMILKEYEVAKTAVWWDMSSCPVPRGYDPRRVGRSIESALKRAGHFGPLSIIAMGNLTNTPSDVLEALACTGIRIKHIPSGERGLPRILTDISLTRKGDSLPATVMLISGGVFSLSTYLQHLQVVEEFTLLLAYSREWVNSKEYLSLVTPKESSSPITPRTLVWESLLTDSGSAEETSSQLLHYKCSKTGPSPWFCTVCRFPAKNLQSFCSHLKSKGHADHELDIKRKDLLEEQRLSEASFSVSKLISSSKYCFVNTQICQYCFIWCIVCSK